MARPREFDIDIAVSKAMDVFWAHGYEGASLPQLLDGMSLSRGSLYKAFRDKRSLYLKVLEKYESDAVVPAVALLNDDAIADGADRVKSLFQMAVAAAENGDHRGCLLCTAAAGSAAVDETIAQEVHRLLQDMRSGFTAAMEQSPLSSGNPEKARTYAALLLTQYIGLRVLVRSKAPQPVLMDALDSVMQILGDSPN